MSQWDIDYCLNKTTLLATAYISKFFISRMRTHTRNRERGQRILHEETDNAAVLL